MALPLSISILSKKRDKIRDTIAAYEAKLRQAQADLAHVNATLRLFAATGEPEDFPPYVDLNRVFRRGETTTFCIQAIRNEGPLDTRELAYRLMTAKGLDTKDKVLVTTVSLRIVQSLRMRARRGQELDGSVRRKGVCVWKLATPRAANTPSSSATPDDPKQG